MKMEKKIIKFIQVISYPFMNFYFKKFYGSKVDIRFDFKKGEKYIFAPNHQSYVDPFIIFYSLPLKDVYDFLPFMFMTTPKFMNKFFVGFLLKMFGCYDSSKDSLKKSVSFLEDGSSVCIFPQGKFSKNKRARAKVGVAYIHREVKDSVIVPVNVNYSKKKVDIVFIKKIKIKKFPKDLQIIADRVLESIKRKK